MGSEFQDALDDITGGGLASGPAEQQLDTAQATPVESNAFSESLSQIQESAPTPEISQEPGGMER